MTSGVDGTSCWEWRGWAGSPGRGPGRSSGRSARSPVRRATGCVAGAAATLTRTGAAGGPGDPATEQVVLKYIQLNDVPSLI